MNSPLARQIPARRAGASAGTRQGRAGALRALPVALFLVICAGLFADYRVEKQFSADGVNYFYSILEHRNFTRIDHSRRAAEFIEEWPLVAAVRGGISDFGLLKAIFAFGLFSPYLIGFLLSLYAVRGQAPGPICFALVSMLAVDLSSDYDAVGEHHVMALLSWPALLLSVRRPAISRLDTLVTWGVLAVLAATYPTAACTACVVAGVLIIRLALGECADTPTHRWMTVGSVILCARVVAVSVHSVLFPLSPSNRESFAKGIVVALSHPLGVSGVIFAAMFALALRRRPPLYAIACVLPALGYLGHVWASARGPTAALSFSGRTLTLTALPLLLVLAALASRSGVPLGVPHALAVSAFVLAGVGGVAASARDWQRFRSEFHHVLDARAGFVDVRDTPLWVSPDRWSWNNPLLSVVWGHPCVRTIVLNAPAVRWELLDPRTTLILKRYVAYARPMWNVDKTATPCP